MTINERNGAGNSKPYLLKTSAAALTDRRAVFTPDSSEILLVSGFVIQVWSIEGHLLKELRGHKKKVIGIAEHPSHEGTFVSCDEEGNVFFWKPQQNEFVQKLSLSLPKGNWKIVSSYMVKSKELLIVLVQHGVDTEGVLYSFSFPSLRHYNKIGVNALLGETKVAVGLNGEYVTFLTKRALFARGLGTKGQKRKAQTCWDRNMVCIACHPHLDMVAAGHKTGAVYLYHEFFAGKAVTTKLHWHSFFVSDIVFSPTGSELFSIGHEGVLVRWNLLNGKKDFLARLGGPTLYAAANSNCSLMIISHCDNALSIVSLLEWNKVRTIQGFTTNINGKQPVGLLLHPILDCLITNSKPGYLQFFDGLTSKVLYHLDVTMANIITGEDRTKLHELEVQRAAVSSDATWLATSESNYGGENILELRLKFWKYDMQNQSWALNTSIEMPHFQDIGGIVFQPVVGSGECPKCATIGGDKKFKMWEIAFDSSGTEEKDFWTCTYTGEYRDLAILAGAFSPDGSLFGAAFYSTVTLWSASCLFKASLSQPFLKEPIRQVVFGCSENSCSLLVTRTDTWLCCWDLLRYSLNWRVSVHTTALACDPLTGVMAAFTKFKQVVMFEPQHTEPLLCQEEVCHSPVVSAIFVPPRKTEGTSACGEAHSTLYFLTESQLLYCLCKRAAVEDEEATEAAKMDPKEAPYGRVHQFVHSEKSEIKTPFALLMARKQVKSVETKATGTLETYNMPTFFKALEEVRVHHLELFTHHATAFCSSLIPDASSSEVDVVKQSEAAPETSYSHVSAVKKSKKKKKALIKQIESTNYTGLIDSL